MACYNIRVPFTLSYTGGGAYGFTGTASLINYKWSAQVLQDGTRQLVDNGAKPKYHADLYTGQGMAFDGTHNISVLKTFTQSSDTWTLTFDTRGVSANGYVWDSMNAPIIWKSGTNLTYYDGTNTTLTDFSDGVFTVCSGGTNVSVYKDGEFVNSIVAPNTTVITGCRNIGGDDSKLNGVLSNVIFIQQELTPSQIQAQYNNPEQFLYRDSGVLKSNVLTQAEIDDIVLYIPCCDTDKYARDLVEYSEGVNVVTNGTFDIDTDWVKGTGVTISGGTLNFNTSSNENANQSIAVHSGLVLIEYENISYTSGTPRVLIENGVSGVVNLETSLGKHSLVYDATGNTGKVYFYGGEFGVGGISSKDNITVKELTGIYPITNYTDLVRTNAENLPTGVQTYRWLRTPQGLPTGLSPYMENDGVSTCDTGYVAPLTEDWTIRVIMNLTPNNVFQEIGVGSGATEKIQFGITSGNNVFMQGRNVATYSGALITQPTPVYMTIIKRGSNNELYVGKTKVQTVTDSETGTGLTFFLNGRNTGGSRDFKGVSSIRLFQVDSKALSQEELDTEIDKATAQGLLS